ncbi:hypothetical protein Pfo_011325 [Paulownia fortunei]|nr:hypothetical protein Pfo_011325 [Paulownia fortunei]
MRAAVKEMIVPLCAAPHVHIMSEGLNTIPPRVVGGYIAGVSADVFQEDTRIWQKKRINKILCVGRYRNIMDMNAGIGSFAASLESPKLCAMNVNPTIAEKETLDAIYEQGLTSIYQDWNEALSTYPRICDLIHASSILSLCKGKCSAEHILLEMDRMLRPEGTVIIRDHTDVLIRVKRIASGMRWNIKTVDDEDGPLVTENILFAVK